jgi:Ulp1 family protease
MGWKLPLLLLLRVTLTSAHYSAYTTNTATLTDASTTTAFTATITTTATAILLQDPAGWLTSQIIDIRLKQLQAEHPDNYYFNTSFFGLLCPSPNAEPQTVDYTRVAGWTKPSRLPGGTRNNLFQYSRVFFPINEGGSHWVLVVAENAARPPTLSFYDSLSAAKDGSRYISAVRQYLMEEGKARGFKWAQCLDVDAAAGGPGNSSGSDSPPSSSVSDVPADFAVFAQTPQRAPRQSNNSDCGVLMLHYISQLSTRLVPVRYVHANILFSILMTDTTIGYVTSL